MSKDTVKLGLMPPLTGLVGIYGSEITHAGQIACQEVNENGGVLGRPLELVIEDDGSLPESAVAAAEKLVDQQQCTAIIGNLLSNSRIAVAYRVAETRKIPFLNFSFYEGSILSRYFFHFAALPNQQIDMMIPFMRNHFGPRMFFAGNNYEWPRGSIQAAKCALGDVGGEVVGEEYTKIGVSLEEIENLLDHVEATKPDVFVPYFAGADQVLLLTRFTIRGLKKYIAVVMGHYDEMMASNLSPEVRKGFYSSNTYFMSLDTAENHNFLKRLARLSDVNGIWPQGNGILTNFGEGTYICVKAFAKAANKAGSIHSEALVDALKTITVSAPQGRVCMNHEHHHATINCYLSCCQADGVFGLVEQFGVIKPKIPARYNHQRIDNQSTLEDDIRLQSRMLEGMAEAVLLVNSLDGTIIYTNSRAEKMFGYDTGEMGEQTIKCLDAPNTPGTHQTSAKIISILNLKGVWQGETQLIKKDGIRLWCAVSISTLTHPVYGEVWLWVANDITERKQAEIALQETTQLLNNVLNSSPDFIFVKNTKLQTILANKAYAYALGKTPDELVGHTDIENGWNPELIYGNPGKGIRGFELDDKAVLAGETIHNPYDPANVDGEIRIFDTHKLPLLDLDGEIIGVLGVARDTTERIRAEEALRESEERWQFALEGNRDGVWDWNVVTSEVFFSARYKKMLGYEVEEFHNQFDEWASRLHPDDKENAYADVNKHFDHETSFYENEHRILCKDGSYKWVLARGKVVSWTDKQQPLRMIGTQTDISDRKLTEEKLRLFSRVFRETNEGIMITDATNSIIEVNPASCNITGFSREDMIGQNPRILCSGKQSPEFYVGMWQTINEHGHWQGELWNRKKDGTLYAELLNISSILNENGNIVQYVGLFSDITYSKQQQEALVQMAHYDVLTQLPNRMLFSDRFTQAMHHCKRNETLLAVCFLDLDNFKPVNDRYGHDAGDRLLIEVAERIKATIREEDTVSRQGGDEFALLLGDIELLTHCEQLLERILHALSQPYFIDNQSVSISASIGVSLYPKDDADLDTLMRHADQAMYQAKLAGRNRYSLFNAEQNQLTIQKHIRLQEIQNSLINNELCLHYQPKVNMTTGKVFGAEALIRWLHPEQGMIPPLKFLPIIEGTELEILIGDWVINEALKQLECWREQDIELEVSINISPYHLQSPLFVANLEKALARFPHVDATHLQLEILESSALGDLMAISNITKTCTRALGVNIALDDFGTGYSSLTHLRNLFAKTIKIDQTFVRDALDDPNDYTIIDGVIGLANSFNREVIAEGVETTEHGLMLLIMGCNEAQGYGIAKPMSASDIPDWLTNYTPNQAWLACGNKIRTLKEKKIKLFRLAIHQWQLYFESNIQSSPDSNEHWPIMKKTKCHCGVWIKRAIDEPLFEENGIKKLDEAHDSMHKVADDLFNKYQKGEIDTARDGLTELRTAFEQLSNVLGQCE